jgi:hypothetical protein
MTTRKPFTIEEGIEVQTRQLDLWKTILIPEVYEALEEYTKRNNNEAKSGYDIKRGTTLDFYVSNYMLGHRF